MTGEFAAFVEEHVGKERGPRDIFMELVHAVAGRAERIKDIL